MSGATSRAGEPPLSERRTAALRLGCQWLPLAHLELTASSIADRQMREGTHLLAPKWGGSSCGPPAEQRRTRYACTMFSLLETVRQLVPVRCLAGWLPILASLSALLLGSPAGVMAEAAARRPLSCAVEGSARPLRASELCRVLQRELKRPLSPVHDARSVKRGDALQLIHDDVQWTVIWLSDGRIKAWTRVSKVEAADDQVRFLARAVRALAKAAPQTAEARCIRLDPNGGHKMRSPDLSYPWAELAPCARQVVEVVDPWWLPVTAKDGGPRASAPR